MNFSALSSIPKPMQIVFCDPPNFTDHSCMRPMACMTLITCDSKPLNRLKTTFAAIRQKLAYHAKYLGISWIDHY